MPWKTWPDSSHNGWGGDKDITLTEKSLSQTWSPMLCVQMAENDAITLKTLGIWMMSTCRHKYFWKKGKEDATVPAVACFHLLCPSLQLTYTAADRLALLLFSMYTSTPWYLTY